MVHTPVLSPPLTLTRSHSSNSAIMGIARRRPGGRRRTSFLLPYALQVGSAVEASAMRLLDPVADPDLVHNRMDRVEQTLSLVGCQHALGDKVSYLVAESIQYV